MPTYSYRCTECDNAFDIHQAFTDDTLTVCEVCGGRLRKLFNTIGVTFNGSGFYRTDSRAGVAGGGSDRPTSGASSSGGVRPAPRHRRSAGRLAVPLGRVLRSVDQQVRHRAAPRQRAERAQGFEEFITRGNVIDLAARGRHRRGVHRIVSAIVSGSSTR